MIRLFEKQVYNLCFFKYPKDNGLINSNQDIVIVHILLGTYTGTTIIFTIFKLQIHQRNSTYHSSFFQIFFYVTRISTNDC